MQPQKPVKADRNNRDYTKAYVPEYRGVVKAWDKYSTHYESFITSEASMHNEWIFTPFWDTAEEAARAYDVLARIMHLELNFPDEQNDETVYAKLLANPNGKQWVKELTELAKERGLE